MSSTVTVTAKNGVDDKRYPEPLASHEDVVGKASLFWETLRSFHTVMGTKYMVPIIGGVELNMHLLYVEVTKRGGYDKVVSAKKWREISSIFNFSPTTTSASYALRKHYFSFLYHYEQVYFSKPPGSLLYPEEAPLCFEAVGTIDGKLDCGYLVSVKLGSEILNGILYHPEQPNSSELNQPCNAIVPYNPDADAKHSRRRRHKKRRDRGDPSRPKPNRSGYNFFFAKKHSELKSIFPERERQITKMIGESWNNLNEEEKKVYRDYGLKDKERYQKELKEYKERMKVRQPREANKDCY